MTQDRELEKGVSAMLYAPIFAGTSVVDSDVKQVTKEDSVVSHTAVDNYFLHVFVGITVANAAVSEGKSCVGVVVGPAPFFLVVLLLLRRNGSLELCLCTFSLTDVSFRTVPQCDYGQSRGKKKLEKGVSVSP